METDPAHAPFLRPETEAIDAALSRLADLASQLVDGDFDASVLATVRDGAIVPSARLNTLIAALEAVLGPG